MAPCTLEHVSVLDLTGDDLTEYIAWHLAEYGLPPLAGGAPDEDEGADDDDDDDADREGDDDTDDDADEDDQDDDDEGADDWKAKSRKNERDKKKAEKRAKAAEAELAALKKGKQSDQEKALSKARDDAKAEAKAEADKLVREARLEGTVARLATSFADPEDALSEIERAIKRGDLDEDDIFTDDGKVDRAEVEKALKAILKRKPHLAGKNAGKFRGGSDARKGSGGAKSDEDKSVDEHLAGIRRHK